MRKALPDTPPCLVRPPVQLLTVKHAECVLRLARKHRKLASNLRQGETCVVDVTHFSTVPIPDALPELLGKPDEEPFGATDVAEPIRLFILNDFAGEFRAPLAEPGERLVDIAHSEHDA